jgi:hypothetical protein
MIERVLLPADLDYVKLKRVRFFRNCVMVGSILTIVMLLGAWTMVLCGSLDSIFKPGGDGVFSVNLSIVLIFAGLGGSACLHTLLSIGELRTALRAH